MIAKAKQVMMLWLEGFREALSLHRVIILCHRSRKLLIPMRQCFLLNGVVFLGSLGVFQWFIVPALEWILPDSQEFYWYGGFNAFLRGGLSQLFYVFWFYPLYMVCLVLNYFWCDDIAKYGLEAMEKSELSSAEALRQGEAIASANMAKTERPSSGLDRLVIGVAEKVYSIVLLAVLFLQVYLVGFIPYIGKILEFLLLSWMHAFYCYDYKWNFSGIPLQKKLCFFESNWAFFAGFGSPGVLATFFFSPLVRGSLTAILFPLFVLTATGSGSEKYVMAPKSTWKCAGLGRLPIFYAADTLLIKALSMIKLESPDKKTC